MSKKYAGIPFVNNLADMSQLTAPIKILELTCDQLTAEFARRYDKGRFHSAAVYREVFHHKNWDLYTVEALRENQTLAGRVTGALSLTPGQIVREVADEGVTKLIYRLHDGHEIESVVIPMPRHITLCISCQAGCRMRCRFCETGRMGFYRNLTAEEIVGQVYTAKIVRGINVKNIVFMGMGEPFDNFEVVIQAIRVMNDPRGLNIAHSHITVSTAGRIDGIRKLAALNWPRLNLAVSLNAPGDTIRSQLMPINRQFSMDALRQSLADYPLRKAGCFLVEYVLIKGINDRREQAGELARFLKPLRVRLNLIAFNPGPGSDFEAPSEEGLHRFRDWLVKEKVFVRLRSSRGQNIMAACGQLGNSN